MPIRSGSRWPPRATCSTGRPRCCGWESPRASPCPSRSAPPTSSSWSTSRAAWRRPTSCRWSSGCWPEQSTFVSPEDTISIVTYSATAVVRLAPTAAPAYKARILQQMEVSHGRGAVQLLQDARPVCARGRRRQPHDRGRRIGDDRDRVLGRDDVEVRASTRLTSGSLSAAAMLPETSTRKTTLAGRFSKGTGSRAAIPTRSSVVSRWNMPPAAASDIRNGWASAAVGTWYASSK